MMNSYEHIEILIEDDLAFLIFNRPDQLNAMNRKMMGEIIKGIEEINLNEKVKVAIIQGKGRAFMAGADIKEYGSQTPEEFRSFQDNGKKLYDIEKLDLKREIQCKAVLQTENTLKQVAKARQRPTWSSNP